MSYENHNKKKMYLILSESQEFWSKSVHKLLTLYFSINSQQVSEEIVFLYVVVVIVSITRSYINAMI